MKRPKLFFASMLVSLLGVGVFSGISLTKESTVEKAEAASGTKRIFLDCIQHSDYDNAQSIGIQYYTGSYLKKECTKLADNYWYVDVPSTNLSKVQFFRCDTGNVNKNYNWQWEGNPSVVNYYSVKGWDNNGDWSNANGADESYEVATTSPSSSTKRIWVDPKDNFYDGNARAGLRVFNGDTHYKTYILGGSTQFKIVNSQYLFYVDIPVSYDCQLVRLHNVFNTVWTYGGNFSNIANYNTANVVYSWATDAGYSAGNEGSATVDYAKALLDGYSTCESSAVNGYGNYSNIMSCVVDKLSTSDKSTFRNSTFSASGYGTRTYGEKLDTMNRQNSPSSRILVGLFADSSESNAILPIIIVSASALAAVGGYFLLRKKKED